MHQNATYSLPWWKTFCVSLSQIYHDKWQDSYKRPSTWRELSVKHWEEEFVIEVKKQQFKNKIIQRYVKAALPKHILLRAACPRSGTYVVLDIKVVRLCTLTVISHFICHVNVQKIEYFTWPATCFKDISKLQQNLILLGDTV